MQVLFMKQNTRIVRNEIENHELVQCKFVLGESFTYITVRELRDHSLVLIFNRMQSSILCDEVLSYSS